MQQRSSKKIEKQDHSKYKVVINLHNEDTKYSVVQNASNELGLKLSDEDDVPTSDFDWDIKWADVSLGSDLIKKMNKHQRINYFIGISSIARKNLLMQNLYTMKNYFPQDYDFFPETFQYPADLKKIIKFQKQRINQQQKVTFIVKPEASCQGRGIYLCQHINQIENHSKSIVQQYISRPLLYEGLKFDFRVYVLLKNLSPLEIYIYKQGLVRLATQQYEEPSKHNLDNLCLHLTNYAVNKLSPKYEFNKTMSDLNHGHKKSLAQFFKSLQSEGYNSYRCWRQIKDCIVKTILSVQPHLHSLYRKAQPKNQTQSLCFQILGFDFMMNEDNKVYLLEVNQSPSFSTQTPLDFLVKSYLIKDTLNIVLFDKERKKVNLQLRSKRTKTQTDLPAQTTPKSQYPSIPSRVRGNYELIYPASNQTSQKLYEKMLKYIKADYHKTTLNKVPKSQYLHYLQYQPVIFPQLKGRINQKESLQSLFINQLSLQSMSLGRKNPNNSKLKFLSSPCQYRNSNLDQQNNSLPSIKKRVHSSLNNELNNNNKTIKKLTINLSPQPKHQQRKNIQQGSTCPIENWQQSKDLDKQLQRRLTIQLLHEKNFLREQLQKQEQKNGKNDNKAEIESKWRQNLSNQSIKQRQINLSWFKKNFSLRKQIFRSQLNKYVKYINPIHKATQQRTQSNFQTTQQTNKSSIII